MKVLIADDDAMSRRLVESSLVRWGYEAVVASDGLEASHVLLGPDAPKLALLDWLMPGIDGAQLCEDIRRQKPEPYTYIIMLTSKQTKEDVIRGLEAGADDYVCKPFDPSELKVRLRTGKRILYLQDQLIGAREALRDLATRDQLTNLWNRATILTTIGNELNRASREGSSLAVMVGDLDNFKQINDTYGHPIGDEVLRAVAQSMREVLRPYDSVGRYGGEEFVAVLPGCVRDNASSHGERIRAAISRLEVSTPSGVIRPTISVGVAVADRQCQLDAHALIVAADAALYEAKRAGRNRVVVAEPADCALVPG
ncbi:MAG: diguanylate cyclase [Pirellulales bacterium]|nr:diguanylate cyclase [Pirellulales bacterium]